MKNKDIIFGLIVAFIFAGFLSWFASSHPDGLERVAEGRGFLEKGEVKQVVSSPIADYLWPGIKNERLATTLAGVSGVLIVFGLSYAVAALLKLKKNQ